MADANKSPEQIGEERIREALDWQATELDLSGLELAELPQSIRELAGQLQVLRAYENHLSTLPEFITEFKQLQGLYIWGNRLTELPAAIGALSQLGELDVSKNRLEELPESIGSLSQLWGLYAQTNRLRKLPESIGELSQLQSLYLSENQLNALPDSLRRLRSLKEIYLHGNDRLGIPSEILGPTWEDVRNRRARPTDAQTVLGYYFLFQPGLRALETGDTTAVNRDLSALHELGHDRLIRRNYESARQFYQWHHDLAKKVDDWKALAFSLHELGVIAREQGDYDGARALLRDSKAIFESHQDQAGFAIGVHEQGRVAANQGNYDEARRLVEMSSGMFEQCKDEGGIATGFLRMGWIARQQEDYGEARRLLQRSREIFEALKDQNGIARYLYEIGRVAQQEGEYQEARDHYLQSLQRFMAAGSTGRAASCLLRLSEIALLQGEYEEAARLAGESFQLFDQWQDPVGLASALRQQGRVAKVQNNRDEALRYLRRSLEATERLVHEHHMARLAADLEELRHDLQRLEKTPSPEAVDLPPPAVHRIESESKEVGATELRKEPPPPPAVADTVDEAQKAAIMTIHNTVWQNLVQSVRRPAETFATRTLDIHLHPAFADQQAAVINRAVQPAGAAEKAAGLERHYTVVLTLREESGGHAQPLRYFEGPLQLEAFAKYRDYNSGDYSYGEALHRTLFHSTMPENVNRVAAGEPGRQPLMAGYIRALEGATSEEGLRLQLRIDSEARELHNYKWEYIWDATGQVREPLACSSRTPFARVLQVSGGGAYPPLTISRETPLRLLVAMASPEELSQAWAGPKNEELNGLRPIERAEAEALITGLAPLELIEPLQADNLLVTPDQRVSLIALRRRLEKASEEEQRPFRVLHLICHGLIRADGKSYLVLEDDHSKAALVPEDQLAEVIRPFVDSGLRLVVLASCFTALPNREQALQGLARRLVEEGVPAVIAMQDRIEFTAAQHFSQRLYAHLIHYGEIDRATNAARRELWLQRQRGPRDWEPDRVSADQWGVPVLFMRLPDGHLFTLREDARAYSNPDIPTHALPYEKMPGAGPRRLAQEVMGSMAAQMGMNLDVSAIARAFAELMQRVRAEPEPPPPEEQPLLFGRAGQERQRWALVQAASEHRWHPARRAVLLLRGEARTRIAQWVKPADRQEFEKEFREKIWHAGDARWDDVSGEKPVSYYVTNLVEGGPDDFLATEDGREVETRSAQWRDRLRQAGAGDAAAPLKSAAGRHRVRRRRQAGAGDAAASLVRGNLTWEKGDRDPPAAGQPDPDDLERLRDAAGDPFRVFAAVTSDTARSKSGLDERTASLLLHAVRPDLYLPYHGELGERVLARMNLQDNPRYNTGFQGYCRLAADLLADDDLGFEDLADVGYFLQRLDCDRIPWRQTDSFPPDRRVPLRDVALKHDEVDSEMVVRGSVWEQVVAALNGGKHVMLIGPPGTGKTTLAQDLCRYAHDRGCSRGHILVTATADWTTFDTVGGYMPESGDRLIFRPGIFLNAIEAQKWLIIDEINRADIDKAFGELFTVLSGQTVTLPYRENGRPVRILPPGHVASGQARDYTVHPSWRIIATMNVYDKASLFAMSYAFMRRFAFVDVDIPCAASYQGLLRHFWQRAGLPAGEIDADPVGKHLCCLFKETEGNSLMKWRALGPAIAQDLVRYLGQRVNGGPLTMGHLAEAVLLYVVPQFDGLEQDRIVKIYEQIVDAFFEAGSRAEEPCRALLKRIRALFPFVPEKEWKRPPGE